MEDSSHPTTEPRRRRRKKKSSSKIAVAVVAVVIVAAVSWAVWPRKGAKTQSEYDMQTGRLSKLVSDLNKNGVMDTVSYMDGTRFVRNELDFDENGKTERWDIFLPDGKTIEKVGISSKNDGVMDAETYYDDKGLVARILQSTKRDGVYDRTEFYEAGILKRSQDDVNRDGKPDKWETYAPVDPPIPGLPPYTITSTAFDDSGSGRPERRLVFGPGGQILRAQQRARVEVCWRVQAAA